MNKYRAIACCVNRRLELRENVVAKERLEDEKWFRSKKEALRFIELCLEIKAKEISGLKLQVAFPFEVNGIVVATYYADFTYYRQGSEQLVVEDSKGRKIEPYPLKKKLFLALYPQHKFVES